MFTVQYRCLFREFWYDQPGSETTDEAQARAVANVVHLTSGRAARVVDEFGQVRYVVPVQAQGFRMPL